MISQLKTYTFVIVNRFLGKGDCVPKLGMEPIRREALIQAAIVEIGRKGALDVTVSQISKRAGMSPALAHHYFGSKRQMFLAAMRRILDAFGQSVRRLRQQAKTPKDRLKAVVEASFETDQFESEVVAAWLVFYVEAQRSADAARLLKVYVRRMNSNLVHDLSELVARDAAQRIAHGVGAMIDGIYIRQALQEQPADRAQALELIFDYIDRCLDCEPAQAHVSRKHIPRKPN